MFVESACVVIAEETAESRAQVAGTQPDDAGNPLLHSRCGQAEHQIQPEQSQGDVDYRMIEHGHLLGGLRRRQRATARSAAVPLSPSPEDTRFPAVPHCSSDPRTNSASSCRPTTRAQSHRRVHREPRVSRTPNPLRGRHSGSYGPGACSVRHHTVSGMQRVAPRCPDSRAHPTGLPERARPVVCHPHCTRSTPIIASNTLRSAPDAHP